MTAMRTRIDYVGHEMAGMCREKVDRNELRLNIFFSKLHFNDVIKNTCYKKFKKMLKIL